MGEAAPPPVNAAALLRAKLLSSKPEDYTLSPTKDLPHVWAACMEWSQNGTLVTLVAVAEGSTSLYFGNGGGIIGAGQHDKVKKANRQLLTLIDKSLKLFVPAAGPLDALEGAICFAVFTYDGLRVARDHEERLTKKKSPAWPVFYTAHGVISAVREVSENRS